MVCLSFPPQAYKMSKEASGRGSFHKGGGGDQDGDCGEGDQPIQHLSPQLIVSATMMIMLRRIIMMMSIVVG